MNEPPVIDRTSKLYATAIHEAGHLVARYVLFGNIDTILYVSLIQEGDSLGRNKEDIGKKEREISDAFENDDDFFDESSYAFKESCYSLAGTIAEKVEFNMDSIVFETATEDLQSLDSFLGVYYNDEKIGHLIDTAVPETERLVNENIKLIEKVADALMMAPNHVMDNHAFNSLVSQK